MVRDLYVCVTLFVSAALFLLLLLLLLLLHRRWRRQADHWRRQGVPSLRPLPLVGDYLDRLLLRRSVEEIVTEHYRAFEGHRFGGVFNGTQPVLMLLDLQLIKRVLTTDFAIFNHRGSMVNEQRDPLHANLFHAHGSEWRWLRRAFAPAFTAAKTRMVFPLMEQCALHTRDMLMPQALAGQPVEMYAVTAHYTISVIGTCAFGLELESIQDPNCEFVRMSRAVFKPSFVYMLHNMLGGVLPALDWLLDTHFPPHHVSQYFLRTFRGMVDYREKNNISRKDVLQLLMQLKHGGQLAGDCEDSGQERAGTEGKEKDADEALELTENQLAAQAFLFLSAGYVTSATALGFALHELALQPALQTRLREEVGRVLRAHGGRFTHQAVMEMEYLDCVASETMRRYPATARILRRSTAPWPVPGTQPQLTLPPGSLVMVPVHALHNDPKYFPDPQRFDPERFSEPNRSKLPKHVYMPFGDGPRYCIAMKLGLLQLKLGLAELIRSFEFSVCEKTVRHVKFCPKSLFKMRLGGNWLAVTPLRQRDAA